MALFHPKAHEVAFVYDIHSARSQHPPIDLLPCQLQIDKRVVQVWIAKHALHELHVAGVRIYKSTGEIHHDVKEIR